MKACIASLRRKLPGGASSKPSLILALPLLLGLSGGCVMAAVGAGAALTTQEFMDNATLAFLKEDPEVVWRVTRETIERRSLDEVQVDEEAHTLRANIEGATVTAQVQRFDASQTRLAISAKKWGLYDADQANTIITLIKRNLER